MPNSDKLNVTIGGKYTVVQDSTGRLSALRYGEPWRDCCGDGLIYSLAAEVESLRERNHKQEKALLTLERSRPETVKPSHLKNGDAEILRWIQERLENVHGENPKSDYMQRLGFIISGVELTLNQAAQPRVEAENAQLRNRLALAIELLDSLADSATGVDWSLEDDGEATLELLNQASAMAQEYKSRQTFST